MKRKFSLFYLTIILNIPLVSLSLSLSKFVCKMNELLLYRMLYHWTTLLMPGVKSHLNTKNISYCIIEFYWKEDLDNHSVILTENRNQIRDLYVIRDEIHINSYLRLTYIESAKYSENLINNSFEMTTI